jgi:predicted small metal-binding protein
MPSFKCKDIGMDCTFEAKAGNEAEIMKKIGEHASKVHGMKTIPPDVMAKVKKAIKP